MKKVLIIWFFCSSLFFSCNDSSKAGDIEKWKSEIVGAEKNFNDLAQKEGITKAFQTYAAQDGVIKRGKEIIKGNEAISEWYRKDIRPNETLTWKPDFVDVSISGDLGYTYGSFIFTSSDSTGTKKESVGKFHTVWKRQNDGNWKFVWD
jgi:ketosteroid isomerase-like protein